MPLQNHYRTLVLQPNAPVHCYSSQLANVIDGSKDIMVTSLVNHAVAHTDI